MAVSLHERGVFEWGEFRTLLVEEIGAWERGHPDGEAYRYYARWLAALERLMLHKRLCSAAEVDARLATLAARPHGHDHDPT
jgi:nitrile hydratase accessory protein